MGYRPMIAHTSVRPPRQGASATSTARSCRLHTQLWVEPGVGQPGELSATVLGMSYTPSTGVTTSLASSGITRSPSTKRPPGRSRSAMRANRSALPGPSSEHGERRHDEIEAAVGK